MQVSHQEPGRAEVSRMSYSKEYAERKTPVKIRILYPAKLSLEMKEKFTYPPENERHATGRPGQRKNHSGAHKMMEQVKMLATRLYD